MSGKVLYDPKGTSHAALEALLTTPTLEKWKVLFADLANGPSTAAFDGVLTKFEATGMEVEANLEADFTIKVSGFVTMT
jgi:hypothetical protein